VRGVLMELEDCAFPQLAGVVVTDEPQTPKSSTRRPFVGSGKIMGIPNERYSNVRAERASLIGKVGQPLLC
jgi:hypothetical protein